MTTQGTEQGELPAGRRLRCATCGSELIVITKAVAELTCCGGALVDVGPPGR